jgi:hypothetical protein
MRCCSDCRALWLPRLLARIPPPRVRQMLRGRSRRTSPTRRRRRPCRGTRRTAAPRPCGPGQEGRRQADRPDQEECQEDHGQGLGGQVGGEQGRRASAGRSSQADPGPASRPTARLPRSPGGLGMSTPSGPGGPLSCATPLSGSSRRALSSAQSRRAPSCTRVTDLPPRTAQLPDRPRRLARKARRSWRRRSPSPPGCVSRLMSSSRGAAGGCAAAQGRPVQGRWA